MNKRTCLLVDNKRHEKSQVWGLCHGHFANPINVEDRRKIFKFYPAGITVEKGVVVCSLCWERHKNDIDKEPSVWEIVAGPKVSTDKLMRHVNSVHVEEFTRWELAKEVS